MWFFTLQIQIFYVSISIAYYHINYTNSSSTETSAQVIRIENVMLNLLLTTSLHYIDASQQHLHFWI